jgi:hypothetical protein
MRKYPKSQNQKPNVEKTDRSSGQAFAKPSGIASASLPGNTPMSTPTPPAVQNGPPAGAPALAPGPRGVNPDNMLPPAAFHKR